MSSQRFSALLLLALPCAFTGDARADVVVYGPESFSDVPLNSPQASLTEWSPALVEDTPGTAAHPQDRFLGRLGCSEDRTICDTLTLRLRDLPAHTWARISFDLYVIGTWDGSDPEGGWGPDIWTLSVDGGQTLIETTFSNVRFVRSGQLVSKRQSFPESYPGGDHPVQTGASESNELGYYSEISGVGPVAMSAVYELTVTFDHGEDSLELEFRTSRLSPKSDESWGLDNVEVRVGGPSFRRGFVNTDESLDVSDAVALLGCLFLGTLCPACLDAADCDDSGGLDIVDPVSLLQHVFRDGPPLKAPFAICGDDPTPDDLDCEFFPGCGESGTD